MTTATASKEAVAPKRTKRPELHVVRGPDLVEMERVLTETAQQMAPMISRASAAKQATETEIAALRGEREGIVARRDLMERMYEALAQSFDTELADIDQAIDFKLNGIGPRQPQPSDD
jgi:hypothetical protein